MRSKVLIANFAVKQQVEATEKAEGRMQAFLDGLGGGGGDE